MNTTDDLKIGGLTKLTTIDYPGHLSAVIFCQGCSWACRYCHNPHLIPPAVGAPLDTAVNPVVKPRGRYDRIGWETVKAFLNKRQNLLDAVVFSGGEPTAQKALLPALVAVKKLGFLIGLHTSGAYPKHFQHALPYLDWVGFDVKAPFEQYEKITGVPQSGAKARQSLEMLLKSKVPFECRTTIHGELLTEEDVLALAQELARLGVTEYHLQAAQTNTILDKTLKPFSWEKFNKENLLTALKSLFPVFSIRETSS